MTSRLENADGTSSQNIRKYLSMLYGTGEPNMYLYKAECVQYERIK